MNVGRGGRGRLLCCLLGGVLVCLAASAAAGARPGHRRALAAQTRVSVSVDRFAPGRQVPRGFLGLSFEAAALPQLAADSRRGDLVRLLRSLGPGVVRFGGITSDENVGFSEPSLPAPPWASSVIDPAELDGIGQIARRSDWKVLLSVGMAHFEPATAAREVAAADRALGRSLMAVEIGNEPDAYGRHGFRELPWIAQGYEEQVSIYREAIDALTPGIPIAGPDVSGSGVFREWGAAEALAQAPALLTGHHYPLGCAQIPPPSIEELLSPATRVREEASLQLYLAVARSARIPVRIDETNSVSCGGVPGISDTFASALWAAGYIVEGMQAGTAGINLEGNPTNCAGYTPLCARSAAALARGELSAQPDWYALLLTRTLVGDRPLPIRVSAAGSPNLLVTAFAGPRHSMKVVMSDDDPPGSPPLSMRLYVGRGERSATVLAMTAPSPSSTSGVLLGGHAVAGDGVWSPPRARTPRAVRAGVLELSLAPSSAVLVTLNPERVRSRPARHSRRSR
jgi:hypothetical protein